MAKHIDKQRLASLIRGIEGISNDDRAALLELVNTRKKYGLVWEDKPEDVEERLREELPVLTEVKERALINGSDSPNHILIEGDNLEALTALSYTHEGKIDVIYIDPPYNTGNKDFVYNDQFVDAEDSYRHSKWLSFMEKRLKIAKQLLSDKGVIFISIDDNEQANLKLLCDEIFGVQNFIAAFTIASNSTKNNAKYVSVSHEYLLCYAKVIENLDVQWQVKKNNVEEYVKRAKQLVARNLTQEEVHCELLELVKYPRFYDFDHYTYADKRGIFQTNDPGGVENGNFTTEIIHPITRKPCAKPSGGWRFKDDEIKEKIQRDEFAFGVDENIIPRPKRYLIDYLTQIPKSTLFFDSQSTTKWLKAQGFDFDFPKALDYIEFVLSMYPYANFTILDFFAGSGTTLHATMQLNAEDGGHRKCILVTNNENNICEEVTYERNKRVINGYTKPNGEAVEGLHNNNLRYYRTSFVPRESSLAAKRQLMAASSDLLCIKHDIYTEKTKLGSLTLKPHIARFFEENGKQMLVIFKTEAIEKLVEEIAKMPEDTNIVTYVFSTNNYAMDADFEDVADKVTLVALPAAIYNAYLKVLPKKARPAIPQPYDPATNQQADNSTNQPRHTETTGELNFKEDTQ